MPNSRLFRLRPQSGGGGSATITVQNQGTTLATNIGTLNFQGSDIKAELDGAGKVKVSVPAGSGPTSQMAYFAAGYTSGNTLIRTTNRLDMNNDTASCLTRPDIQGSFGFGGGCNSSIRGYFSSSSGINFAVSILVFAVDNVAQTLGSTTADQVLFGCGALNSAIRGYFAGSDSGSGPGTPTNVCRGFDFSSDTLALTNKGDLAAVVRGVVGANSSTHGYFVGGSTTGIGGGTRNGSRLTFATDTTNQTSLPNILPLANERLGMGACNSPTHAYFSGGDQVGAAVSTTFAMDFASDTAIMTTRGSLTLARAYLSGANSTTDGYFAGGTQLLSTTRVSNTDGLSFATDTVAMVSKGALTAPASMTSSCQSSGA